MSRVIEENTDNVSVPSASGNTKQQKPNTERGKWNVRHARWNLFSKYQQR